VVGATVGTGKQEWSILGKLTARQVETISKPGRHADGDGLYLRVKPSAARSWSFFYRWEGRRIDLSLGSAAAGQVSLADARQKALGCRMLLNDGINPAKDRAAKRKADVEVPTFGAFAAEYVALHRSRWRNEKHAEQWSSSIEQYCSSIISMKIDAIDTQEVLKVLQPIWGRIPETAARVRGRIENIIDAAKVRGFYNGENPARWKGHLAAVLPHRQKLTRVHHAAIPYAELPAFMDELHKRQSISALALELTILTAARTGEIIGAKWEEFDLEKAIWTIPAERMKAGIEHRVPLVDRAIEILKQLETIKRNDWVFAGKGQKPISNGTMDALLSRMKRADITVHGFRSAFSDWVSEQTSFSSETREHCLAHKISDRAEAAYRRGDQFEKRRKLLEAWAAYVLPTSADQTNVIQLAR
jgi:integrase